MATDVLVSRELKSLQDELSAAKTQRAANTERSAATSAPIAPPTAAEQPPEPSDEVELQGQMRQFAHELTELFGEAEKGMARRASPALLVGILIGRLLGRR